MRHYLSVAGVAGDHQVDAGRGDWELLLIAMFALSRGSAPEAPGGQMPPVDVAVRILGPVRCLGERSHGVAQRVSIGAAGPLAGDRIASQTD